MKEKYRFNFGRLFKGLGSSGMAKLQKESVDTGDDIFSRNFQAH